VGFFYWHLPALHLQMAQFTDQTGFSLFIPDSPRRIISLVPSQTELLATLQLDQEVIGITKFCVHPGEWFRQKQRIGGTKTVNIPLVQSLAPDLILANKEENAKEQVAELRLSFPVWVSDVSNRAEALHMIKEVGNLTNRPQQAGVLVNEITLRFQELAKSPSSYNPLRVTYLIWQNPVMTIGGDTFVNDMIEICGWKNLFRNRDRYPVTSEEEIRALNPDLLLLSSEPFPFKESHLQSWQKSLPQTRILLVNGEYFSWYGSRMLEAPAYFARLLQQIENQP